MSEMNDDNVEKFFRQADPGRFDMNYNENDWKKMEEMLDMEKERLAALKRKRLTYGIGAVVLLIAFSVSWYLLRQGDQSEGSIGIANGPDQLDSVSMDSNNIEENPDAVSFQKIDSINPTAESQLPEGNKVSAKGDNHVNTGETGDNTIPTEKKEIENNSNSQATSHKPTDVKANEKNVSTDRNITKSGAILSNGMSDESIGEINGEKKENVMQGENNTVSLNNKNENQVGPEYITPLPDVLIDSVEVKQDSVQLTKDPIQDKGIEEDKEQPEEIYNRWMITVAVAPDFSKTTNSGYDSPGDAFGVFVHYKFLKRWSVSTGILRSNKKYWGYGDEYNPPYGYWDYVTNGVVPEKVDGNCLVLEVPLSLAYSFVETRRSRVFATAGISSYFMRSEKYEYTFDEPNPGSATGWSTDEPSSYLFGIGSLSVGYDFRVSPTLSFGVEPYYRIPFAGVGWANIDLYSLGFLFNARYRFLKKEHLSSPPGVLK